MSIPSSRRAAFQRRPQTLYLAAGFERRYQKKVETELYGVPLFNRGVNPVTLTPAGEFYIKAGPKLLKSRSD